MKTKVYFVFRIDIWDATEEDALAEWLRQRLEKASS
jgi:hypothetical protein